MSANDNLPPLPTGTHGSLVDDWQRVYTADQMREYARAAISARDMEWIASNSDAYMRRLHQSLADSPWLPIDSAPKDGTRVLVIGENGFPYGRSVMVADWSDYHGSWWHVGDELSNVTHYMPIPPLPEVKP